MIKKYEYKVVLKPFSDIDDENEYLEITFLSDNRDIKKQDIIDNLVLMKREYKEPKQNNNYQYDASVETLMSMFGMKK